MKYSFDPPKVPTVKIFNSEELFPVHRIYCVGKNYAAHAREMGVDPEKETPYFFMKPADAVVTIDSIPYPPRTSNFHYEIELVIAIAKAGVNIPKQDALNHVYGYAVGLDMTRRDLQLASKEGGKPWDTGKGFDYSAPISNIHRVQDVGHFNSGSIRLSVNTEIRQDADLEELIWKNHEIIAELSTYFRLQPGDLIYTGTPAGVGAVQSGDLIQGSIENLDQIEISIT
jgi:fumarylpyruvate hydrolase